ncbi:Quinone oxidoreductase [Musa troglodytarum]|uniref:Quinone oxidoreductase n=1 Tax=Musa troglodytarum TaxID=320322 RepID=A0A9E7JZU1_9LILI|nr:Quinone oxidoreductase [Musa troglodytarum]
MRAVVITSRGGPEVLQVQDVEDPVVGDDEVLIKVEATALNRADTVQRKGLYTPPKGASPYPGLECSGTVLTVGKSVALWKVGDQVHGGSSGIGTFAIQIAKHLGIRVFVTAGSEEKLAACKNLGADVCINYKTEDFVARVKEETGGKGVDVILDNVGGPYLQKNLDSLGMDGRLFIIGFMGGAATEVNLSCLLARRLTVQAAGLRNRSLENKAKIVAEVKKHVWPAIAAGKVKPIVYKAFPLSEAAEAHRLMEGSSHVGKILLIP